MNLLIIDTETTGLDHDKDEVIEVGAILYNVPNRSILHMYSTIFNFDNNPAQDVNNITKAMVSDFTNINHVTGIHTIPLLLSLYHEASYIVAHNAEFDKQWFNGKKLPDLREVPNWLCTATDFKWSRAKPGCPLAVLAHEYRASVNAPHRALTDCLILANVFDKQENLLEMVEYAAAPKVIVVANVPYPGTEAKDAGFQWNSLVSRAWAKKMLIEEVKELKFPCEVRIEEELI